MATTGTNGTNWKELLDSQRTLAGADKTFATALCVGDRSELLAFLKDLDDEYKGPDSAGGGEAGTLHRLAELAQVLNPTQAELLELGIDVEELNAYIKASKR